MKRMLLPLIASLLLVGGAHAAKEKQKLDTPAFDKAIAYMLEQDDAQGPYFRQTWQGMKATTPIISGGMNALRLPGFFDNLGHGRVDARQAHHHVAAQPMERVVGPCGRNARRKMSRRWKYST